VKLATHHHVRSSLGMNEVVNLHSICVFISSVGTYVQHKMNFILSYLGLDSLNYISLLRPILSLNPWAIE